jgi:hypothetical protein
MTYTITYKINKLWASPEPVNGFSNVVGNVFFTITATDNTTSISGSQEFVANLKEPQTSNAQFVPYNELSEAQLLTWAKNSYTGNAVELMEAQVVSIMNKNVFNKSLPWAQP